MFSLAVIFETIFVVTTLTFFLLIIVNIILSTKEEHKKRLKEKDQLKELSEIDFDKNMSQSLSAYKEQETDDGFEELKKSLNKINFVLFKEKFDKQTFDITKNLNKCFLKISLLLELYQKYDLHIEKFFSNYNEFIFPSVLNIYKTIKKISLIGIKIDSDNGYKVNKLLLEIEESITIDIDDLRKNYIKDNLDKIYTDYEIKDKFLNKKDFSL